MAQTNEDFLDVFFRRVEFLYPRLKDTFRFNSATKKSEPCAPSAANAAWSISCKMPKAEAKEFFTTMKAHYEACAKRNKKLPPFSKVFGMKKDDETGTVTFEAKKRGVTGEGKANKRPTVIDNMKNPMPEDALEFWSGSTGTVKVRAFPTVDPDGNGGISLLLDTVQVLKPKYGSANLDGFEEEEVEEDLATPAAAAAQAAAVSSPKKAAEADEF